MAHTSGPEASAPRREPNHARQTAGRIHTSSLDANKNVSDIQSPDTDQQLASTETSKMEVPASHVGRPWKPSIADSTTGTVKTFVTEDNDRTGLPPDDCGYGPSLWTGELGIPDGWRTVAPGTGRYNNMPCSHREHVFHRLWRHVIEIQCNGTDLPNFNNAQSVAPHTGLFPYAHDVIYTCVIPGYRFEDGDIVATVTCSITGWTWNPIVTSCGRMYGECNWQAVQKLQKL